jgi:predicted amidohydrolase
VDRILSVGAAQLGPVSIGDSRADVVARMIALLGEARSFGCRLVVFPELALTTFFPRLYITDEREIDSFFETEIPGPETKVLFEAAADSGIGFYLGYAELCPDRGRSRRFNTAILVDGGGRIVGKYRKVHLPGNPEYVPGRPVQEMEKRYFEVGDRGFPVWRAWNAVVGMCLCNDRRWPEVYRVMGLQGVEMILVGYNTKLIDRDGAEPGHYPMFHHRLVLQAGAYQNATFVVAAAKAGNEDGIPLLAGSCIVAPSGEIVAQSQTEGDELIPARVNLDDCALGKRTVFDFAAHRRTEAYGLICSRAGAIAPPDGS